MKIRTHTRPVLGVVALVCVLTITNASGVGESKPMRQLGRGFANILGGITEVPINIHEVTQEEGDFAGLTLGTIKGVGRFFAREVVGVVEVLTFPVGADPIIQPEFPMQDETVNRWHMRDRKMPSTSDDE